MTTDPSSPSKSPNGLISLLSTLAHSSDKWVQLGTVGLIAFSGVGNWIATWNSANQNRQEIEVSRRVNWEGQERVRAEVIRQVQEIHTWMRNATEEFHKGNEDSAANRKMLKELVDDMEKLKQWKKAEQMRGAPP